MSRIVCMNGSSAKTGVANLVHVYELWPMQVYLPSSLLYLTRC
jgi:hypothetical protein